MNSTNSKAETFSNQRSKDLAEKPIGRLLLQFATPSIIAMSASSIYNLCDSIFIGHGAGPMAIAGLAITFPIMNISAAFGAMMGVGSGALTSVRLGEKNQHQAFLILGNMIRMDVIIGLLLTIIGLVFIDPILLLFGASENTLPFARDYMQIILAGNVITHTFLGLNDQLRASGYPKKAMAAQLIAVSLNIIMDYVFIFIFEWGMRGAALATVLGQVCALAFELTHFTNKKNFVHFSREGLIFNPKIVREIISIGLSPFFVNVCGCIIVIFLNRGLLSYGGDLGDTYVGAYGIVNRLAMFVVMMVMGFSQGMQPIVGFNLGAKLFLRVRRTLLFAYVCATVIMTIGYLLVLFFTRELTMLFTTDEQLISIAIPALRTVMISFPLVGGQMITISFFQSIRKAKKAILLSVTRQMLFLLPLLLFLPPIYGTNGIWYSMPISDLVSSMLGIVMLTYQLRRFKQMGLAAINED